MKAKLKAIEDNRIIKSFVFYSFGDANRFLNFMKIYVDETGCGNGYSAYWPNYLYVPCSRFLPFTDGICIDSRPTPYPFAVDLARNKINLEFVNRMLYNILGVRFVSNQPDSENFKWNIENTEQGIKFSHDNLPPTERPRVGDMYRIPRSRFGRDTDVFEYNEGRIIEDLGDNFKTISCVSEHRRDPNPKIFKIKANRVIKINDWLNRYK